MSASFPTIRNVSVNICRTSDKLEPVVNRGVSQLRVHL
jgi:hypothetical protein